MDDMHAFERQVARRIEQLVGPVGPVDDAAIVSTISTQPARWGLQPIFNAPTLVAACAIVALVGGVLLIGQPFERQGAAVPGSGTEDASMEGSRFTVDSDDDVRVGSTAVDAVDFSGRYPYLSGTNQGEMALYPGGFMVTDDEVSGIFTEMDDPRLNGSARYVMNRIVHQSAGDVVSYTVRIDNDGGSWLGTGHGYVDTANPEFVFDDGNLLHGGFDTTVFRGADGYEGLSAIMVNVATDEGTRIIGAVFPGEMPELPEMPAAVE